MLLVVVDKVHVQYVDDGIKRWLRSHQVTDMEVDDACSNSYVETVVDVQSVIFQSAENENESANHHDAETGVKVQPAESKSVDSCEVETEVDVLSEAKCATSHDAEIGDVIQSVIVQSAENESANSHEAKTGVDVQPAESDSADSCDFEREVGVLSADAKYATSRDVKMAVDVQSVIVQSAENESANNHEAETGVDIQPAESESADSCAIETDVDVLSAEASRDVMKGFDAKSVIVQKLNKGTTNYSLVITPPYRIKVWY